MLKAEIQTKNSFWAKIDERFDRLEQSQLYQKAVLTFDEASRYSGIKKSYLYKLTSRGELPHYKPNGKMIFIDRIELETWLLRNRIKPVDELEKEAATYVTLNRKGSGL
jgi:excisionase family DNA binding protein